MPNLHPACRLYVLRYTPTPAYSTVQHPFAPPVSRWPAPIAQHTHTHRTALLQVRASVLFRDTISYRQYKVQVQVQVEYVPDTSTQDRAWLWLAGYDSHLTRVHLPLACKLVVIYPSRLPSCLIPFPPQTTATPRKEHQDSYQSLLSQSRSSRQLCPGLPYIAIFVPATCLASPPYIRLLNRYVPYLTQRDACCDSIMILFLITTRQAKSGEDRIAKQSSFSISTSLTIVSYL